MWDLWWNVVILAERIEFKTLNSSHFFFITILIYTYCFSIDLASFLQKASSSEQNSNTLSSNTSVNQQGQSSLISQQIVPQMTQNVAPRAQTYDFNQFAKEATESIKAAVGVSIRKEYDLNFQTSVYFRGDILVKYSFIACAIKFLAFFWNTVFYLRLSCTQNSEDVFV